MTDKIVELRKAHQEIADCFNFNASDVAFGFPMERYDDAIRIAQGIKGIQEEKEGLLGAMGAGTLIAVAGAMTGLASPPMFLAITGTGVAISGISGLMTLATRILFKDREKEVLAAIVDASNKSAASMRNPNPWNSYRQ